MEGYWVYQDALGQWRWYFKASNGRKLADSGEGYFNKSDCLAGIRRMQQSFGASIRE